MKRSIIITCSILLGILLSQTQQAKAQGSVKLVSDTESYTIPPSEKWPEKESLPTIM